MLSRAELVVHDRLVEPSLLGLCPPLAERRDVGKRPGGPADQGAVNAMLVEAGLAGRMVVRLKGGDPFVFGRGGEEAMALEAAGVAYEVVPGVSSAIAAPAYAGLPVTQRGLSSCFTVVTGHSRAAIDAELNWEALAQVGGPIVVLMGVAHRAEIADRLMAGGLVATTPAAAVRWGTRWDHQVWRGRLGDLADMALEPPVTMMIGQAASIELDWFPRSRPLLGRQVVVTRTAAQAGSLSGLLVAAGAGVIEVPLIEVVDAADRGLSLRGAASRVRGFDWVVFTSANAVGRFVALLRDAREFGATRVAAIGVGTAGALGAFGVAADLVPARSVAEGLLEAFPAPPAGGGRIMLARAAVAREVLPAGLRSAGWEVEVVEAYRTRPVTQPESVLAAARRADAITFTSASSVRSWLDTAGVESTPPAVVCIGPVTGQAAISGGLRVAAVAEPHTIGGLVDATIAQLGPPD